MWAGTAAVSDTKKRRALIRSRLTFHAPAYLLTTSALQLVFGKFYSFLSIKRVFITAICVFELGSLLCGLAPNSASLIAGRATAGVGSAGLLSGSMLILAHSVPLAKRPVYSGLIGGMYGVASVAGPLLGGFFTDRAVRTTSQPFSPLEWDLLTRYPRLGAGVS